MLLFAALLLSHTAIAEVTDSVFTSAEIAHRHEVLANSQAAIKAAARGPACDYLDQLSSAAFLGPPPKATCAIAFKDYEQLSRFDQHLRESCRSFSTWIHVKLYPPFTVTREEIRGKRKEAQGGVLQANGEYELSPSNGLDIDDNFPAAEQANMDCALPVILLMQYRKKSLQKMQEIYSNAERVLDDDYSADQFFRYLDDGEN
ncbi:MAG: hypothetical protein ACXVB9_22250 [Bdellovibrionota bacterium]